jgi:hypothetical protein
LVVEYDLWRRWEVAGGGAERCCRRALGERDKVGRGVVFGQAIVACKRRGVEDVLLLDEVEQRRSFQQAWSIKH